MPLDELLDAVGRVALEIRDGLSAHRGTETGQENPSGERQLAADVWADERVRAGLLDVPGVVSYASEERSTADLQGKNADGYHVAVDPLDGSSNLATNNPLGILFGAYDRPLPAAGRHLVVSGYVLFGPLTTMTVARDGTVSEYLLESDTNHTPGRLLEQDLKLPAEPTVLGIGGSAPEWQKPLREYVRSLEGRLKQRYAGALVADVNQVLGYGGMFAYPELRSRPDGKLRLLFEGNPVAHIIETAGGRSSNGEQSLLDVTAERLHQRVPVHVGNSELIEGLERSLAEH